MVNKFHQPKSMGDWARATKVASSGRYRAPGSVPSKQARPGQVKTFEPTSTPRDERGTSVTPSGSSEAKWKQKKVRRSQSGHSKVIKTFKKSSGGKVGIASGGGTMATKLSTGISNPVKRRR